MKLTRCLLVKGVLIAGDIRADWDVEKHGGEMWLEDGLLHIRRKGQRFVTSEFVGAWGVEEETPKALAKGATKGALKGLASAISDEALKP